jgi:hypothetical protein
MRHIRGYEDLTYNIFKYECTHVSSVLVSNDSVKYPV